MEGDYEQASIKGMTPGEFYAWLENQVDSYELVNGQPVRVPEDKQGGRRMGQLYRAAKLSMDGTGVNWLNWIETPLEEFEGREPFVVAADSWASLYSLLLTLPEPPGDRMTGGRTFADILELARRLAQIEVLEGK